MLLNLISYLTSGNQTLVMYGVVTLLLRIPAILLALSVHEAAHGWMANKLGDPTARSLELPDGRSIMLVDTVGFVRRLPHHLVEAFKSTLEETVQADILINVCDISSGEADSQTEVTRELLHSLKADKSPMLNVLNKCDLIEGELPICTEDCVLISAATGFGIDEMLKKLSKLLPPSQIRMNLLIPYSAGGISAEIRESGRIFSEEFTENGTLTDALVDVKILHKVEKYQV